MSENMYVEIEPDGSGGALGPENADVRFDSTVCADCGDVVAGHFHDHPYRGEVNWWTTVFRSPDGRLVCEGCVPDDATTKRR